MTGPHTRTTVRHDHALIAPDTHVVGPVPGWTGCAVSALIGPAMGARFGMSLVALGPGGRAGDPEPGVGRFLYVLSGALGLRAAGDTAALGPGGYAYLPADTPHTVTVDAPTRVCVVDKPYVPAPDVPEPTVVVGSLDRVESAPMPGAASPGVQVLLPEEPAYDMAVNVMTFAPGAALPFTETHVMEHGLLVLEGTLVYRLADAWYPVGEGDVIWMAPFCPQWACAYGTGPARYLIYKDWNRDVLA